jgi:hypothetical protein
MILEDIHFSLDQTILGGVGMAPGYITRSNYVDTSHYVIGLGYKLYPEICRFDLNCMEAAVGFSINITWKTPETYFGSFRALPMPGIGT